MRTRGALLIVLTLTVFALLTRPAGAGSGVTITAWASAPPVVDGNIGATEWAGAATILFGPFLAGTQTITGSLKMMNDLNNLYIAVAVAGDDDFGGAGGDDLVCVQFDNDHGAESSPEQGDDSVLAGSVPFLDNFFDTGPPLMWRTDTAYGGTEDGQGAANRTSTNVNHFELSHPLNSADDAHDFSLSIGQTVGFRLQVTIDGITYTLVAYGLGTSDDQRDWPNYVISQPRSLSLFVSPPSVIQNDSITLSGTESPISSGSIIVISIYPGSNCTGVALHNVTPVEDSSGNYQATFVVDPGRHPAGQYSAQATNLDTHTVSACVAFTVNSPAPTPVGGVVIPANTFALVAPWIAVIGLVGCIGTAVVVAKKRQS